MKLRHIGIVVTIVALQAHAESFTRTYNTVAIRHIASDKVVTDSVLYGVTNFIFNVGSTVNIQVVWPNRTVETFINVGHIPNYRLNDGTTCQMTYTYNEDGQKGWLELSNDWVKLGTDNNILYFTFYNTHISSAPPTEPQVGANETVTWLGLKLTPATKQELDLLPRPSNVVDAILEANAGMRVVAVDDDSKAAQVGIQAGDYIIAVNDHPVVTTVPTVTTSKVSITYSHEGHRLEALIDISGT